MKKLVIGLAAVAAVAVAAVGAMAWRTQQLDAGEPPRGAGAPLSLPAPPAIDPTAAAQRLAGAIRFETVSFGPGEYDPVAFDGLHAFLKSAYPRTFAALALEQPHEKSLLLTWAGSDPDLAPILLLAHQDVVPVPSAGLETWSAPPFAGDIRDGKVIGRGAIDDKGALIAILEGVEALLAAGFQPKRTVILAFGHDEEAGGGGARAMAALLAARGVKAWFVLDEGLAIVETFPITGKPAALIGLAEKGNLTVLVKAVAQGGHASMPPADTAVGNLARALVAIQSRPFKRGLDDGPAGEMLRRIAPQAPYALRFAIANRWAFGGLIEMEFAKSPAGAAVLQTTIAPTMLRGGVKNNVLAQEAQAILNLRLHPRDTVDGAVAHLRSAVAGIPGVEIIPGPGPANPSPVSSAGSDAYALIAAAARAAAPPGASVAPGLVLAATDARHYVGVAQDVYRFAPAVYSDADLASIHGNDEKLSVDNLGRMVRFYAQLIAGGAG